MGALTQVYVDPSIAGNSGTGTLLDPFGDLQYALNTITRDATNGDQINIKAGTAEVLAASLSLATYGTPTEGAPLILRGYTSAANDGGMGEIDCNGVTMWAANSYSYVVMAWLTIHNGGNNNLVNLSNGVYTTLIHCNVHKGASTPSGKILIQISGGLIDCYVHDAGTTGIGASVSRFMVGCYFYNCVTGIENCPVRVNNIFVDCTTALSHTADYTLSLNNTVYSSTASTGVGINAATTTSINWGVVINNIVEGYSGVGGKGIGTTGDILLAGYNAFYNNATPESYGADVWFDLGNDATLAASPFTSAATGNFSLLTSVAGAIETAFPGAWYGPAATTNKADMGAVQNGAGTGGAVSISPFRGNIG